MQHFNIWKYQRETERKDVISGDSIIKCLWSYIEMLFSFYDGGGQSKMESCPGYCRQEMSKYSPGSSRAEGVPS